MREFKDLEYIALEGGGGKGAVYKGAILALEELFYKDWLDGKVLRKKKDGSRLEPEQGERASFYNFFNTAGEFPKRNYPSILNYYDVEKEKVLKIKGISGSSAGAITAFPLSLGLTSEDIKEILESFSFSEEFLPSKKLHTGKYRMMGMNIEGDAKFLIAEDRLKKLGEEKITPYSFSGKQEIGSNFIKDTVRSYIISSVLSIIYTGIKENWNKVSAIFKKVGRFIDDINYLKKISVWLKSNVIQKFYSNIFNSGVSNTLTSLTPVPWNSLIKTILKLKILNNLPWGSHFQKKIADLIPLDNSVSAIGNLIWDRGIYAGFEIREFFFKVLLMSISNDTHFKRVLLKSPDLLRKLNKLTEKELQDFFYKFNDKFDDVAYASGHKVFSKLFINLPEILTFKELYTVNGINLCICVTNSTTSQPVYFSHYFTPDFPVLEALGASMGFPIAFKPIYNEANVLKCDIPYKLYDENFVESKTSNPTELFRLKAHESNRSIYAEIFSIRNYNKFLSITLRYVKKNYKSLISINGNLSFRSFLPYLIDFINQDKFPPYEYTDELKNKHIYDSQNMKFLCYFFYNSAFKGLLVDGGATNNLPMSIFTFVSKNADDAQKLDNSDLQDLKIKKSVLALKLDNSFPDDIKDLCFGILSKDKNGKVLNSLTNWQDKLAHFTFAKKIFKDARMRKSFRRNQKDLSKDLSEEAWVKISKELVNEYIATKSGFTPWNKQFDILSGLINSLSFGFDQGQIESISDNENIIPLYCYGIGTLDFDLTAKKLKPLVELANSESEKTVIEYFINPAQ